MRRYHRWLGLVLLLPLVAWVVTGLLFHVKHRYAEAYESLSVPIPRVEWARADVSAADVITRGLAEPPIVLAPHPSGALAWFGARAGQPIAIDATTGETISPATDELAREWMRAAIAQSEHAARYGVEIGSESATSRSARTGVVDPALRVRTSGGKTVTVDRVTGEIRQTGDLNEFIDATYDVHYLKWTPWPAVNVGLVLFAIVLVLGLAGTGTRLLFAGRARNS